MRKISLFSLILFSSFVYAEPIEPSTPSGAIDSFNAYYGIEPTNSSNSTNTPINTPSSQNANENPLETSPIQSQNPQTSIQTNNTQNHPLLEQRKKRLLGVYGMGNIVESDAKLSIEGFATQTHNLEERPLGFGLQAGYLLNENHRIILGYEKSLKKNGFAYTSATLGYAFTPRLPNTSRWRALLGANAGLAFGKFDRGSFVVNNSAMDELSYTGITYGIKLGAIYESNYGELEFGVQSKRLDFGEEASKVLINDTQTGTKLDLSQTSSTGFFFGYNYLF
ncbi:hypothetical protein B6S12_05520 [Helicobacter valdiviensis]|uniref:Outer membrane protein beta-barrel domain-containing protein n=1 Tax=Helicobacter valdiviensis TaxID=1458358 RepID=A0A2W6PN18_9HELI|nr:hypothetical protein [Helicobacter valdiviensis]PZT48093.1 hypothetical protein B6S12_05520 [Helicobacter valdiviensis]